MKLDLRGRQPKRRRKFKCMVCSEPATFREVSVFSGSVIRLDGSVVRFPDGRTEMFCDRHSHRDLP